MPSGDCPRCIYPMSRHPALSRTDDKTDVCGNCGLEEAIEVFTKGQCSPQDRWPVWAHQRQYLWEA